MKWSILGLGSQLTLLRVRGVLCKILTRRAISLFTITSFDTISQADASAKNIENQEFHENATVSQADSNYQSNATKDDHKLKTHHNFIASYLLQESSVKRNAKKADTEGNFVGGILRLHKIIITKTLGSF